jgi:hypothetical protein
VCMATEVKNDESGAPPPVEKSEEEDSASKAAVAKRVTQEKEKAKSDFASPTRKSIANANRQPDSTKATTTDSFMGSAYASHREAGIRMAVLKEAFRHVSSEEKFAAGSQTNTSVGKFGKGWWSDKLQAGERSSESFTFFGKRGKTRPLPR